MSPNMDIIFFVGGWLRASWAIDKKLGEVNIVAPDPCSVCNPSEITTINQFYTCLLWFSDRFEPLIWSIG